MFVIDINLNRSHKRYMRVQAPDADAAASILSIHAILSKKDSGAFGGAATESGLAEKISA